MSARPLVSLVIPAGRGPETLEALLESLARSLAAHPLPEPPPVHVSVDRDCAWPGEMDKLRAIWTSVGGTLHWIASERTNATAMRNRGVEDVTTPRVAFLDDDVEVDVTYLRELAALAAAPAAPVVQGIPYLCSNGHRLLARLESHNYESGLRTYLRESGRLLTLDARNLLIETDLIRRFPFDEELLFAGEGQDLAARLGEAGIPLAYTETLRVYHRNRETAFSLAFQKFHHGRGRAQLMRKTPDLDLRRYLGRYAVRHFVEPAWAIATRKLSAADGLYRLGTNAVFWTGVLREMATSAPLRSDPR